MKRRRALLLSTTLALALCAACGGWLHRERQQYALDRQLINALEHDDTKTAMSLVNAGANPNTCELAAPAPSLKLLLRQLLSHQPRVNSSDTAFLLACGAPSFISQIIREDLSKPLGGLPENLALVQAMIAHGAEVHTRTVGNQTALHLAASTGRWHTAELLLQHGLDVDVQDSDQQTPLMYAVTYPRKFGSPLLLVNGAQDHLSIIFAACFKRLASSAALVLATDRTWRVRTWNA